MNFLSLIFFFIKLNIASPVANSVAFSQFASSDRLQSSTFLQELNTVANYQSIAYCLMLGGSVFNGPLNNSVSCKIDFCTSSTGSIQSSFKGLVSGIVLVDDAKKEIRVVFKGSTELFEWMTNFTFSPVQYNPYVCGSYGKTNTCKNCQVHVGFKAASDFFMKSTFNDVISLLNAHPDYTLYSEGHSLGGAVAILVGNEMKVFGYNPIVVTYGQPKVGNQAMCFWMDKLYDVDSTNKVVRNSDYKLRPGDYIRVIHTADIVPLVPPTIFGYAHGGIELQIVPTGTGSISLSDIAVNGKYNVIDDISNTVRALGSYITRPLKLHIVVEHLYYFKNLVLCSGWGITL
ncbi:unnamed protein product [[Candida] boidinii]|uniref:triacylglycerol lipase n=1 Tax=Candida boidinii TaxID=5477 RepID=A0A9W6SX78_CANBO|nr:hypothetical protein BVG19_g3781 [[Candida] boidinii]OWB50500.1 hypothetical protein B5S27_g2050 [[Candida] boidinii]OWB66012.1 hypothetical protein B5S30_g1346 [[Candida] boidinii]GME67854.1 unnamed protein product [[Candida] boidinii]GMG00398.1 unnamed protein product [[Candida] boidinii]